MVAADDRNETKTHITLWAAVDAISTDVKGCLQRTSCSGSWPSLKFEIEFAIQQFDLLAEYIGKLRGGRRKQINTACFFETPQDARLDVIPQTNRRNGDALVSSLIKKLLKTSKASTRVLLPVGEGDDGASPLAWTGQDPTLFRLRRRRRSILRQRGCRWTASASPYPS